jgi:organic hydroperoxide reductase OsmC/OhrA
MSVKVLYTTHAVEFVARQTLVASLTATVGGLSQAEAEKLVAAAHQVCPYSNATRGNLDVGLEVSVV